MPVASFGEGALATHIQHRRRDLHADVRRLVSERPRRTAPGPPRGCSRGRRRGAAGGNELLAQLVHEAAHRVVLRDRALQHVVEHARDVVVERPRPHREVAERDRRLASPPPPSAAGVILPPTVPPSPCGAVPLLLRRTGPGRPRAGPKRAAASRARCFARRHGRRACVRSHIESIPHTGPQPHREGHEGAMATATSSTVSSRRMHCRYALRRSSLAAAGSHGSARPTACRSVVGRPSKRQIRRSSSTTRVRSSWSGPCASAPGRWNAIWSGATSLIRIAFRASWLDRATGESREPVSRCVGWSTRRSQQSNHRGSRSGNAVEEKARKPALTYGCRRSA